MIVLDASAAVDLLVGQDVSPDLLDLAGRDELHAPELLDYEVASALRGHALAGRLPETRLSEAVQDFEALRIHRHPLGLMLPAVLDLRANFTVYDAAYVVLAQTLDVRLVTADAKLLEAGRLGVEVLVLRGGAGGR